MKPTNSELHILVHLAYVALINRNSLDKERFEQAAKTAIAAIDAAYENKHQDLLGGQS